MSLPTVYSPEAPSRAEVDALPGPTVIEFGTNWCGFCKGAQPAIGAVFAAEPRLRYLKIEDGPGRPLGRSFRVKLWPTLVLLQGGVEVARVVRPNGTDELQGALAALYRSPAAGGTAGG